MYVFYLYIYLWGLSLIKRPLKEKWLLQIGLEVCALDEVIGDFVPRQVIYFRLQQ